MFFNAAQIGIARQPTAGATVSNLKEQGILGLSRSLVDLIKKQA
jgi:hypothetical protein